MGGGINKIGPNNSVLSHIVFFYFVLLTGSGSYLVASIDPRSNIAGTILFLMFFIPLVIWNHKVYFKKQFVAVFAILLVWVGIHFFDDNDFQYFTYGTLLITVIAAYAIANQYGKRILVLFENAVFCLCCVSLIFWCVELLLGSATLASFAPIKSAWGAEGGSFLIYTTNLVVLDDSTMMGLPRNSGFAWEPGRFASIICLAFTFRLIRKNGVVNIRDPYFLVFVLTLLTTFSTTGYVTFFVLILFVLLLNKRIRFSAKSVILIGLLVVSVFVLQLPFMKGKILERLNPDAYLTNSNFAWLNSSDEMFTVDRFEGLMLDFLNFIHDPVWGYGLADSDRYISTIFPEAVTTSNGLTKTLAQFGILFGIPLFFIVIKSFAKLSACYGFNKFTLFLVFALVSISYYFFNDILMLAIIIFPMLHTNTDGYVVLNNNGLSE